MLIDFDWSAFEDELDEFPQKAESASKEALNLLALSYQKEWERLYTSSLKKTKSLYKNAILPPKVDSNSVTFSLSLSNFLVKAVEEGAGGWDEKPFFQQSKKAKSKKDGGWYLVVPFRHASAKSIAESSVFSSVLPAEIQKLADNRSLKPVTFNKLPPQYQVTAIRKPTIVNGQTIPAYEHKSPIYENLQKIMVDAGRGRRTSQYMTFRTVSDKSDVNSWIHPEIIAGKFMEKAWDGIKDQFDKSFSNAIKFNK